MGKVVLRDKSVAGITGRCYSVLLTRATGHHNPVGWVREVDGGWATGGFPSAYPPSDFDRARKRTMASAVLAVVKDWQRWVGLEPGKLDY